MSPQFERRQSRERRVRTRRGGQEWRENLLIVTVLILAIVGTVSLIYFAFCC